MWGRGRRGETVSRDHDVEQAASAARVDRIARDRATVEAVRAGDMAAFEAVFREYYAPLVAFATSYTHDNAVAEELVAESFATLWERRVGWRIRTTIEAFVFGVVRHRITDAWRVRKRRRELDTAYAADPSIFVMPAVRPDDAMERVELETRIARAIDALPHRYRTVVILRVRREMGYEEIAEALGVSSAAVQQQMSRAVRMLRAALR